MLYSFSFLLIGFQLLPSIELYLNSARSGVISPDWFRFFRIPVEYLATFIAPDFFGNPTTRNQWGNGSYVEMMGYVGLVPLIFALSAVRKYFTSKVKNSSVKFFFWTIIISLLLSLKTPIADIILWLKLPVFATSSPARIIALVSFSLAMLAGFGLDSWIKSGLKFPSGTKIVTGLLILLWLMAFTFISPENASVAQRNLILPSLIFFSFIFIIYFPKLIRGKFKSFFILHTSYFIILITLFDLFRFHHKFTPYSPKEYFYPNFKIQSQLANFSGIDRSFGLFDADLNLPFNFYSLQGYDSLFPARYGELTRAHKTGIIDYPDRVSSVEIGKNEQFTMPLINLLAARFIIQPTVHGSAPWEFHLWEYPDQFKLLYDDDNFQIFQNSKALPRVFATNQYKIVDNDQDIVNLLLTEDIGQTLILENEPKITMNDSQLSATVEVNKYQPNTLKLKVNTNAPALVYLADNYYPGWKANVNGKPTEIIRANYTFRAIPVSEGESQIDMVYMPQSFTAGIIISLAAVITLPKLTKKYEH